MKKETILNKKQEQFLLDNGIKVKKVEIIKDGISNINFLINEEYVLKCGYDSNFFSLNQNNINLQNNIYKQLDLSVELIAVDYKNLFSLTKYIPNLTKLDSKKINYFQIIKLIDAIKAYKKLDNIELDKFDYNATLNRYRLLLPVKERLYFNQIENSPLINLELEISHLDLVDNNILFTKDNQVKIIDFEMGCKAFKYFDLTSLLEENNFKDNISQAIIHLYFKNEPENEEFYLNNFNSYCALLDLLWYTWAKARKINCPNNKKEEYEQIAVDKKESLIKNIQLIRRS